MFRIGVCSVADSLTACVVIDYQNIHLTARDVFAPPGTAARDTLIDPVAFADKIVAVRADRQQAAAQKSVQLTAIRVYRGSPSNHREPQLYSAAQRQRAMWSRDSRTAVAYRTLRYPDRWGDPGCHERPQEKGIDVLIALDTVDIAQEGTFDVLILATHDTDLEPALDRALARRRTKIETAGWEGARRIRPQAQNVWHTSLDGPDYVAVRDRRNYW